MQKLENKTPMKPLRSIISKLSPNEIGTFRLFLSTHCRNGKNKKLELFDKLVRKTPESTTAVIDASRQSLYQLEKRLKEELYSFLITQEQVRDYNDRFFIEMDCHKKLYCFKILFDKGIQDHAHQILNEVLNVASKHSLHSIYLEAVNLRNIYFPLSQAKTVTQIPVNHEIRKLKKSLGRNLYINHYLSESGNFLQEGDESFRTRLTEQLTDFDIAENEPGINTLMQVNHLFSQKEYIPAHNLLVNLLETDHDISCDANIRNLVYIELTKCCICMNALADAEKWFQQAAQEISKSEAFAHLLIELQFLLAMRRGDTKALNAILERRKRMTDFRDSEVLAARWSLYSIFISFQQREFRKVIKAVNVTSTLLSKEKGCLVHVKMLELLSIYELEDTDWLYYKIESFRKVLGNAEWKQQRISQIVNLIKLHVNGRRLSPSDTEEKLVRIERELPWHPLGNELINYCTYVKGMLTADSRMPFPRIQC